MRGRNESGRSAAEQEFNAAKTAGELRAARTLADADRASQISDASPSSDGHRSAARADLGALRHAGERIFALRDGVWVDRRYREGMETIRVRAFSSAYFELLDSFPELRPALALGDRVIVAGEGVAIEVGPSGVETLEGAELRRIRAAW
jgi:hypothetical protein